MPFDHPFCRKASFSLPSLWDSRHQQTIGIRCQTVSCDREGHLRLLEGKSEPCPYPPPCGRFLLPLRSQALVSPEHWKGKKGKHLKRLLAEARDAAIILINPTDAHKFLRVSVLVPQEYSENFSPVRACPWEVYCLGGKGGTWREGRVCLQGGVQGLRASSRKSILTRISISTTFCLPRVLVDLVRAPCHYHAAMIILSIGRSRHAHDILLTRPHPLCSSPSYFVPVVLFPFRNGKQKI